MIDQGLAICKPPMSKTSCLSPLLGGFLSANSSWTLILIVSYMQVFIFGSQNFESRSSLAQMEKDVVNIQT